MPERVPLTPAERERRRQRLAAVFGDVLPEQTRDDTREGTERERADHDEQLRRDVPPHHGPVG